MSGNNLFTDTPDLLVLRTVEAAPLGRSLT
jgi:hypothetical protein